MSEKKVGLALLREPFPANQISRLPKPTKAQTEEVRADFKKGIRCEECGAWHHPKVVHLDYVGHAALTDRLLDADPNWNWEPLALAEGLPLLDKGNGLWIKLTVCNVTRLGYGDAAGKEGGDAMKERIGDALRNAAMRFGAALDLWHKGDLHVENDEPAKSVPESSKSIARSEFDALDSETQQKLRQIADEINMTCDELGIESAYDMYVQAKANLDLVEQQVALKSLLSSKIRSAFQKVVAARAVAAKEPAPLPAHPPQVPNPPSATAADAAGQLNESKADAVALLTFEQAMLLAELIEEKKLKKDVLFRTAEKRYGGVYISLDQLPAVFYNDAVAWCEAQKS